MTTIVEAAMNSGSEGVMSGITYLDQALVLAYGGIEFSHPCRKKCAGVGDLQSFGAGAESIRFFDRT